MAVYLLKLSKNNENWKPDLFPGSEEAFAEGCSCPINQPWPGNFLIEESCPVHQFRRIKN